MEKLTEKQLENNYKKITKNTLINIKQLKKLLLSYHKSIYILKDINSVCYGCKTNCYLYKNKNNILDCNKYFIWIQDIKNQIENLLIKILPHSSGIDCNWNFIFHNNGNIDCINAFHAMNNNGYYIKLIPIKIKIFRYKKNIYHSYGIVKKDKYTIEEKKDEIDYKIFAPRQDYYAYDLQNYLYQTMDAYLKPYITIKRNNEKYIKTINIFDNWKYIKIKKEEFKKPYIIK